MWKRTAMVGAGALAAVAIAAGCSSNTDSTTADPVTTSVSSAAPATPAPAEAHNDADAMFAQHMIPHHQQAVEMSDMLLAKQGIDPRVSELASQIKAAQGPEIEQMQGWLEEWGTPPMPSMDHGNMDHGSMQGMMSEADMTALQNAEGAQAAKLFLTQMIAHHEGAITMAQDEIDGGQFPDAVSMARTIVTTQQEEIDTMRGLLGEL